MLKRQIYTLLEEPNTSGFDRFISFILMGCIILNVLAVILETVPEYNAQYAALFTSIETWSMVVFTVEYALRLWSCTTHPQFAGSMVGRVQFATRPITLIDLWALLPFYLPAILPVDLRVMRAIRLLRLFPLLKLARYTESMRLMKSVLKEKQEELYVTLFSVSILLIVAASLVYFAEREAQPNVFTSIPASMWWAISTLTTVGYGDIYPITPLGKVLGAIVAVLGIGLFALPTGILSSSFMEHIQRKNTPIPYCPRCHNQMQPDVSPDTDLAVQPELIMKY